MGRITTSSNAPNLFNLGWNVAEVTATEIVFRDHRGNIHVQKLQG